MIKLNLADMFIGTKVLGPGLRAAVWVQGCPFKCVGCISPEWIPQKDANVLDVLDISNYILSHPELEGITISGGEPFLQFDALSALIQLIKSRRKDFNVICFTGYSSKLIIKTPIYSEFLTLIDVLIDGPYIKELNKGIGLRGSSNQNVIHLTDRLLEYPFEAHSREIELHIRSNHFLMVGVPPLGVIEMVNSLTFNDIILP
jgi:anaerobic ribonucleoside-triphosphate reductase activating protein